MSRDGPADRRVHAIHTAVPSVVFALMVALSSWMERTTTTVPRRVRLLSRAGVGLSVVLGVTVALPRPNLRAQTGPHSWGMVLGAAAVTAVPALEAALRAIADGAGAAER